MPFCSADMAIWPEHRQSGTAHRALGRRAAETAQQRAGEGTDAADGHRIAGLHLGLVSLAACWRVAEQATQHDVPRSPPPPPAP